VLSGEGENQFKECQLQGDGEPGLNNTQEGVEFQCNGEGEKQL